MVIVVVGAAIIDSYDKYISPEWYNIVNFLYPQKKYISIHETPWDNSNCLEQQ